eukprot:7925442-Heterocapsa_arctica.AAC.1
MLRGGTRRAYPILLVPGSPITDSATASDVVILPLLLSAPGLRRSVLPPSKSMVPPEPASGWLCAASAWV